MPSWHSRNTSAPATVRLGQNLGGCARWQRPQLRSAPPLPDVGSNASPRPVMRCRRSLPISVVRAVSGVLCHVKHLAPWAGSTAVLKPDGARPCALLRLARPSQDSAQHASDNPGLMIGHRTRSIPTPYACWRRAAVVPSQSPLPRAACCSLAYLQSSSKSFLAETVNHPGVAMRTSLFRAPWNEARRMRFGWSRRFRD
jgi:hypothetical protein